MHSLKLVAYTLLCLGLNLLIPYLRAHPRLAKLATLVVVLNEIRGLVFVVESRHLWLPLISH